MSKYNVGDLVKDNFDRIHIVKAAKINKDGNVYALDLLQVAGEPLHPWQVKDGIWSCFPIDVAPLSTQGVINA
jgi:hypothetical protein